MVNQLPILEISDEMRNNLAMLKRINYITNDNHIIWNDRVILKVPCVFAYGDFITNRNYWYESIDKSQGMMVRISRINKRDINSITWPRTEVSGNALMKYPWMMLIK